MNVEEMLAAADVEIAALESKLANMKAAREIFAEMFGEDAAKVVFTGHDAPTVAQDAPIVAQPVNNRARVNSRTHRHMSVDARISKATRQRVVWEWWLQWGRDHGWNGTSEMYYEDVAEQMRKAGLADHENWPQVVNAALASLARSGLLYRERNNGVYQMPRQYQQGKHTYETAMKNVIAREVEDANTAETSA